MRVSMSNTEVHIVQTVHRHDTGSFPVDGLEQREGTGDYVSIVIVV